jgi:hypothetical protein
MKLKKLLGLSMDKSVQKYFITITFDPGDQENSIKK